MAEFDAEELTTMYSCLVCTEFLAPPIRQCIFGHLLCYECFTKLERCPVCRVSFRCSVRNLFMEQVARIFVFSCKYRPSGCRVTTSYVAKVCGALMSFRYVNEF